MRVKWGTIFVCKQWTGIALPLLYENVHIYSVSSLQKFVDHLYTSDQKWDSIRRILYSAPGRWVRTLDISEVVCAHDAEAMLLTVDTLLTKVFPLLPFLTELNLSPELVLSARASSTLCKKDGIERLCRLKGLKVSIPEDPTLNLGSDRSVIELLRSCEGLEQLEMVSPDDAKTEEDTDEDSDEVVMGDVPHPPSHKPLHLPNLKFLSLLSIPPSPFLSLLLETPLPSLKHLMITPHDDSLAPYTASILEVHGAGLSTLHLNTPKHWPTATHPSNSSLLVTCPHLRHLSLDYPLPVLSLPYGLSHPLHVLTIPRPNSRFLRDLEHLLPRLPNLTVVRARNVRWLPHSVSGKALEAGVQGEMRDWRRRLLRRGVRLVDGEWMDPDSL
ncbi:hypothetical protein DENSPDRAFT_844273 [Dentipellis sp. KUC8613]|nr:hypothetical protein DENSPDRAFT_844273 [Dentipellis sp. KUC8613]